MAMNRSQYPPDWEARSRRFRFEVAGGVCQKCGVKHLSVYPKGPDLKADYPATRIVRVYINAAHRRRDPSRSEDEDLIALCPRCHACYDIPDIITKRALGYDYAGAHQYRIPFNENSPPSGDGGL